MYEFSGYEFAVTQRAEGKWIWARIGLISLYTVWSVIAVLLAFRLRLVVPLLAFLPLSIWILVFITWRFVQVEYEYDILSGRLTFSRILGGKSRRDLFEIAIKDAVRIAPLDKEGERERIAAYRPEKVFRGVSSDSAPDIYYMLFEFKPAKDKEPIRAVYYFEATAKALSLMRSYNPVGTVLTPVSR